MKISVSRSSGGKVKLIVGDVLEELNLAQFNRLTDQCIKVRNQMTEIQEHTPDRAAWFSDITIRASLAAGANPHYTVHDGMTSGNRKAGAGRMAKRKAIRRVSLGRGPGR
jgi:hypothetical protein